MNGTTQVTGGLLTRLLQVDDTAVVVHAWQLPSGSVRLRGEGARDGEQPAREAIEVAVERMRFALGVDDDHSGFFAEFKRDEVLGPALRGRPWVRPRRRPWPWEALASAICGQLIEAPRAHAIERRIVRRWGAEAPQPTVLGRARAGEERPLRDFPAAEEIVGRAPAELAAMDLSAGRSLAMVRCAREVVAGRADLCDPGADARLLRIPEIGPWTIQCLGLQGRGDPDSLPAGDLAYIKLVGRLAGLGRRATVEEVEEYFARFAPYRGLAGLFIAHHYHAGVQAGPPLRLVA